MAQQYQYKIDKETITANRLNEDVVVIWGCTFVEVIKLLILSYIAAFVLIMPLALLLGKGLLGMIGVLISGGLLLMFSARWIAAKKEGKPRRYYEHLIKIKMAKFFGAKEEFLLRSGKWTTRRLIKEGK